MKHTPGPWKTRKVTIKPGAGYDVLLVHRAERPSDGVAWAIPGHKTSEAEANVRLITAAPELLEFIRYFVEDFAADGDVVGMQERGRALLEKIKEVA